MIIKFSRYQNMSHIPMDLVKLNIIVRTMLGTIVMSIALVENVHYVL